MEQFGFRCLVDSEPWALSQGDVENQMGRVNFLGKYSDAASLPFVPPIPMYRDALLLRWSEAPGYPKPAPGVLRAAKSELRRVPNKTSALSEQLFPSFQRAGTGLPCCVSPSWTGTGAPLWLLPKSAEPEHVKYLQADILTTVCCLSETSRQPRPAGSYYQIRYLPEAHRH